MALRGNQRMGSWPGRVPFALPHPLPTFLDDALGRRRLTSVDCIQQASMPLPPRGV